MNKPRLERKLNTLFELYYTEQKPSQQKALIKKINDIEAQLGKPLTEHYDPTKPTEWQSRKKAKEIKNTEVVEVDLTTVKPTDELLAYQKHIRLNSEIDKVIEQMLTVEELGRKKQYDQWYAEKYKQALHLVKGTEAFAAVVDHKNRKVDIQRLLELSNQGWTCNRIARYFHCGNTAISMNQTRYFDRIYVLRDEKEFNAAEKAELWNGLTPQKLVDALNNGNSSREIAKEYGLLTSRLSSFKTRYVKCYYKLKGESN